MTSLVSQTIPVECLEIFETIRLTHCLALPPRRRDDEDEEDDPTGEYTRKYMAKARPNLLAPRQVRINLPPRFEQLRVYIVQR